MKKKFFALSTVALFAIGFALYANSSSTVNVLTEENVEALSYVEGEGDEEETDDYIYYPSQEKLFVKHGSNVIYKGQTLNTCAVDGAGCLIDLKAQTSLDTSSNYSWVDLVQEWIDEAVKGTIRGLLMKFFK